MTRQEEWLRRRSSILRERNNNHNHTNHSPTSSSENDAVSGDPPLQPFTHFDVSDDLDLCPETTSRKNCQLELMRNPICFSSKSVKEIYPRLGSVSPPYLLLESLIYLMCRMHGQDDDDSDELFNQVCSQLESVGFLASSYKIDPTHKIHQVFGSTFSKLILDLKCERSPDLSPAVVKSRHHSLLNQWQIGDFIEQARYRRSFGKKTLIARGGFGTVFRARHSLDEVDYAVKVIQFRVRSVEDYVKILREVQLYANLPAHPNVVTYKTAWLESDFDASIMTSHPFSTAANGTGNVRIEELPPTPSVRSFFGDEDFAIKTTDTSSSGSSNDASIVFEGSSGPQVQFELSLSEESHEVPDLRGSFSDKGQDSAFSSSNTMKAAGNKELRTRSGSISDSVIDYGIMRVRPRVEFPHSPVDGDAEFRRFEKISVTLYIQMELCGINLKTWITRRNRKSQSDLLLDEEGYRRCLKIFRHILAGVSFLHSNHLIHRDLKPQNILFDVSEETVKIGDFGLATLHEDDVHVEHSPIKNEPLSANGHTIGMGTTLYTAPEQRISGKYDAKADMYSLGIILFELLHPFNTMMEKEKCITSLKSKSLLPADFVSTLPAASRVILSLTSIDPSRRPSAAQVLSSDLFPSKDQMITELQAQVKRLQEENLLLKQLLSGRPVNGIELLHS